MAKKKLSTHKRFNWTLRKQPFSSKNLLVFAILFGVVGSLFLAFSHAQQNDDGVKPFVEVPQKGLHWAGLQPGTGACAKAYEIVHNGKPLGCTHGPDPAPDGIDATQSVQPLDTGVTAQTTSSSGIVCDGDGVSGNRIQMIYAHASDVPDRYSQFAASFQQYAANMNTIMAESGSQ